MEGVNASVDQVSAAVSAEGAPAPAPVVMPGPYKVATSFPDRKGDGGN